VGGENGFGAIANKRRGKTTASAQGSQPIGGGGKFTRWGAPYSSGFREGPKRKNATKTITKRKKKMEGCELSQMIVAWPRKPPAADKKQPGRNVKEKDRKARESKEKTRNEICEGLFL